MTGPALPPALEPLVEQSAAPGAVRAALEHLAEGTPSEIQRNALVQEAYLGGMAAA